MRRMGIAASWILLTLMACSKPVSEPPAAAPSAAPPAATAAQPADRKVAAEGEMCGGIAGIACGDGLYCAMEASQCMTPDAAGMCQRKAEMCTQQYDPVCGCDNKTYGNACQASSAGVNVAKTGECGTD